MSDESDIKSAVANKIIAKAAVGKQAQPDPADGNTAFSGLTGWLKQALAAGIFAVMAWYLFIQVPRERQAALDHGEKLLGDIIKAHKDENEARDSEVKAVFNRLLDLSATGIGLQKTNLDVQKKILKATEGTP